MATTEKKATTWRPATAAGRLRQRALSAARARQADAVPAETPDDSFEGRRRQAILDVLENGESSPSDSQTGIQTGDLAGPIERAGEPRRAAYPGFTEDTEVQVTRLAAGRAKEMGTGTLLFDLRIGEPVQVAIPGVGVLRTTELRSVSAIGTTSVQIVTRRSTYRLRR